MKNKKQLSIEEILQLETPYFELQAWWGATKHMGGTKATKELIELCHIDKNKYILDVGCGVGATSCYITKKYDCKIVGIDINERMIDRANERAEREKLKNKVEFRIADVQNIPFEDNIFDIVIGESVLTFIGDKQKAIKECVRVVKKGGYIGFNEETLIKTPPTKEVIEYLSYAYDVKVEILTSNEWKKLFENAGLKEIIIKEYKFGAGLSDYMDGIKLIGLKYAPKMFYRFLSAYIKSSAFRKYVKEKFINYPKELFDYVGYGLYVGRKID
ncbi:MAG: methyltransferase domain-containing protein [Nitrososphaerota archaeon]